MYAGGSRTAACDCYCYCYCYCYANAKLYTP